MEKEEWVQAKGVKLYTKQWIPDGDIVATVVFIHGLGEHCNRYNFIFTDFAKKGIKVASFDQRGFGQTVRLNGKHGSCSVSSTLGDINLISQSLQVPMIPHFVMGQSMGGALALLYSHQHPKGLAGVISCSPAIRPGCSSKPNFVLNYLLNTVFRRHLRSVVINSPINTNNLCRDTEKRRLFEQDPLIHSWVSVGLGSDIVAEFGELEEKYYKTFNLPVLITHGSADTITDPEASKRFFDKIPSLDKTFNIYEGFYHELHNEPGEEGESVVRSYIDWILERAKR